MAARDGIAESRCSSLCALTPKVRAALPMLVQTAIAREKQADVIKLLDVLDGTMKSFSAQEAPAAAPAGTMGGRHAAAAQAPAPASAKRPKPADDVPVTDLGPLSAMPSSGAVPLGLDEVVEVVAVAVAEDDDGD